MAPAAATTSTHADVGVVPRRHVDVAALRHQLQGLAQQGLEGEAELGGIGSFLKELRGAGGPFQTPGKASSTP